MRLAIHDSEHSENRIFPPRQRNSRLELSPGKKRYMGVAQNQTRGAAPGRRASVQRTAKPGPGGPSSSSRTEAEIGLVFAAGPELHRTGCPLARPASFGRQRQMSVSCTGSSTVRAAWRAIHRHGMRTRGAARVAVRKVFHQAGVEGDPFHKAIRPDVQLARVEMGRGQHLGACEPH